MEECDLKLKYHLLYEALTQQSLCHTIKKLLI